MNLHLTNAEFTITGAPETVLDVVRSALATEGYGWQVTGPGVAIASQEGGEPARRSAGSAKTQIEVCLEGTTLTTRRLSRGNHKGFVGVVQVQQDHRSAVRVIRDALHDAGLLV